MADLINREALIRQECMKTCGCERKDCPMQQMIDGAEGCVYVMQIEAAPAVYAEPVRHGRWIYDRMDVVCSHCKTVFKDEINFIQHDGYGRFVTAKRCPECGAKMDEKED